MSELFDKEQPKRPECCPKCGSVNMTWGLVIKNKNHWHCADCGYIYGKEIK